MRVNQPASPNAQSSETTSTKKTRSPSKTPDSDSPSVASSTVNGARASISSKARDMATAKAAATSAPDVREDRIAELRKRIEAGQYNVDPDAVAERMIAEHGRTGDLG